MLKNENENDMKTIKNTLSSNPEPIVEEIKKDTSISKQDHLARKQRNKYENNFIESYSRRYNR